jgi:hypothetical protein
VAVASLVRHYAAGEHKVRTQRKVEKISGRIRRLMEERCQGDRHGKADDRPAQDVDAMLCPEYSFTRFHNSFPLHSDKQQIPIQKRNAPVKLYLVVLKQLNDGRILRVV